MKKNGNFRRIWVKEPGHSDTISDEKGYPYRNIRARTGQIFLANSGVRVVVLNVAFAAVAPAMPAPSKPSRLLLNR